MGVKLFGIDVARLVNQAAGQGLLPATLVKVRPGTRTPGSPAAGTNPTTMAHSCRGVVEDYQDAAIDGSSIRRGDRRVTLLGASLPVGVVPTPNDRITILGETYVIVADGVRSDPALAHYSCQVRRAPG